MYGGGSSWSMGKMEEERQNRGGGCKSPTSDLGLVSWVVQRDRREGKTPLHMLFAQATMSEEEQEAVTYMLALLILCSSS